MEKPSFYEGGFFVFDTEKNMMYNADNETFCAEELML